MLASQIPTKFPIPFGNNAAAGTIRVVPQASQTSTSPGQASLYDGFPVATGQPIASGGVPPAMQDFNGILFQTTAWARWQAAAGLVPYDAAFSSAVGGYPQGATVLSATTSGRIWISTADNNTTNPDGGSATNWLPIMLASDVQSLLNAFKIVGGIPQIYATPGSYTLNLAANVTFAVTECRGAGGGGGGANSTSSAGSGGGGGGRSAKVATTQTAVVLAIVVGAGGAAGAGGSSPTMGGTGGTSSIVVQSGTVVDFSGTQFGTGSTLCAATGGTGGSPSTGGPQATARGAGGVGSGGDTNDTGDIGGFAYLGGPYVGGSGGASPGGGPTQPNYSFNGNTSTTPGTGGSGSAANGPGGAGSNGRVTIQHP